MKWKIERKIDHIYQFLKDEVRLESINTFPLDSVSGYSMVTEFILAGQRKICNTGIVNSMGNPGTMWVNRDPSGLVLYICIVYSIREGEGWIVKDDGVIMSYKDTTKSL